MRYKEVTEQEHTANRKLLTLLNEIQNLTEENQQLLQEQK